MAACADNDVNTVRRLLGDGNNTINEGTDDGESLLSLACSAGYYELAQVKRIYFSPNLKVSSTNILFRWIIPPYRFC